jgi:hypothetical protein
MIEELKPLIGKLTIFAKDRMGFEHPPRLFLRKDTENSRKMLGNTAYYDPQEKAVTLFIHNRHPKDILRSYTHELVHHTQNLRGDLSPEKCGEMATGYAQKDKHMREMEREAYEKGNMCFRDWEDTLSDKDTYIIIIIAESKTLKENKTMTKKITKEFLKETIKRILAEEPATSTRGIGNMTGFGADSIGGLGDLDLPSSPKLKSKNNVAMSKPEAAKKIMDISKRSPEFQKFIDRQTLIPHIASSQPIKQHKRYGVMPDMSDYGSFNSAYSQAREMRVPYFYYDKGRKYKIFTAGPGNNKPLSASDLQAAMDIYEIESQDSIEQAIASLASSLPGAESQEVMAAFQALKPEGEPDTQVAPNEPKPASELEENEELEEKVPECEMCKGAGVVPGGVCPACDGSGRAQKPPKSKKKAKMDENEGTKIQTLEQENALYESRFAGRNNRLFENLSKKWTK